MESQVEKSEKKYMSDLHFDHVVWTNKLRFYKDELKIFRNRLQEIVDRNTKEECTALAEQFQNQFIREGEVIETLLHDIKKHEQALEDYAKDHPVALDHVYLRNHGEAKDRMEVFENIWAELRKEYMNFLRKWM